MDRRRVRTAVAIHGTREKESQGALTKGYIIPRAPVPSPQVRWLDPPNPPQPSSQEVVGALVHIGRSFPQRGVRGVFFSIQGGTGRLPEDMHFPELIAVLWPETRRT